jgi:hypothetical protein
VTAQFVLKYSLHLSATVSNSFLPRAMTEPGQKQKMQQTRWEVVSRRASQARPKPCSAMNATMRFYAPLTSRFNRHKWRWSREGRLVFERGSDLGNGRIDADDQVKRPRRDRQPIGFAVGTGVIPLHVECERAVGVSLQVVVAAERVTIDRIGDRVAGGAVVSRDRPKTRRNGLDATQLLLEGQCIALGAGQFLTASVGASN